MSEGGWRIRERWVLAPKPGMCPVLERADTDERGAHNEPEGVGKRGADFGSVALIRESFEAAAHRSVGRVISPK